MEVKNEVYLRCVHMSKSKCILIVEDNQSTALIFESYLSEEFNVIRVVKGQLAIDAFSQGGVDAILLDLSLPDMSGIEVLREVRARDSEVPIVIISADQSNHKIANALKLGANDYVIKPVDRTRLLVTVSNALKEFELSSIVRQLNHFGSADQLHDMVGQSAASHRIFDLIRSMAKTKASVFITGESGVGKEVCAQAIHMESDRKHKRFVAINCAAIPHDLLESEIFGHVKGSFTGATKDRIGAAALADEGTLFLDEIGEMPMDLQCKLLRFIQTETYTPIGSNTEVKANIRFITATNRSPRDAIREHLLREDLFYRLNVISIEIPPLRERKDDVLALAKHFLRIFSREEKKQFTKFNAAVEAVLPMYDWPGNVRELANFVRNTVVLNDGTEITPRMLPYHLLENASTSNSPRIMSSTPSIPDDQDPENTAPSLIVRPLQEEERAIIERAIAHFDGKVKLAAKALKVSPSTLYRKMEKWEPSS